MHCTSTEECFPWDFQEILKPTLQNSLKILKNLFVGTGILVVFSGSWQVVQMHLSNLLIKCIWRNVFIVRLQHIPMRDSCVPVVVNQSNEWHYNHRGNNYKHIRKCLLFSLQWHNALFDKMCYVLLQLKYVNKIMTCVNPKCCYFISIFISKHLEKWY